jgi:6-phosphogluconolactonase
MNFPLIHNYDDRRDIAVPGNYEQTLDFCAHHFVDSAKSAIDERGRFLVALSGGRTPEALYKRLLLEKNRSQIDWEAVWVFWSDERCVSRDDPGSNYYMAMEAAFAQLPVPKTQIFPMNGMGNLEENAAQYQASIKQHVPQSRFDLIMLGMGNDGHTASLFPHTAALHAKREQWVLPNSIKEQDLWRLTFTFPLINQALQSVVYVMGKEKAATVRRVFNTSFDFEALPVQGVGTASHKALWILDEDAARK